jgi:hypothetical protein
MWQLYSGSDSVAIRIPYKSLAKELKEQNFRISGVSPNVLTFGSINYYKFNDIDGLSNIAAQKEALGFVKDYSFQHENEFRVMIQTESKEVQKEERRAMILDEQIEQANERRDQRVVYLNLLNFNQLPFEIVFHPQSSDWHRKNVMALINKYELSFKTHQSSLKEIFKR